MFFNFVKEDHSITILDDVTQKNPVPVGGVSFSYLSLKNCIAVRSHKGSTPLVVKTQT